MSGSNLDLAKNFNACIYESAMKYLLHPRMIVRKMTDPQTGKKQVVRQYIRAEDLIKFYGLNPSECEIYDARKHKSNTGAKHVTVAVKEWFAVSSEAVGTPAKRNRKGLFSE